MGFGWNIDYKKGSVFSVVMKARKLLQPQYLDKFHCIGPNCEDSCCIGWRVTIDKSTYQRYRKCSDVELFDQMKQKVTRNRTNANDENYAKVKLNPDGCCPFINEERLCAIQKKLGEESLSVICTTYPRISNTINDRLEKSLTVSCPEAARLVLLEPGVMEFDEAMEDDSIRSLKGTIINTDAAKMAHRPQKYFWELRIFTISVLQNREYPLWQRLIILGMFYNKLNQLIVEAKVHEVPQLIGNYTFRIAEGLFKEELQYIPNETTIQMELMKELADEKIFAGVNNKRFLDCFMEFLHGIQYTAQATKEEVGVRYNEAYTSYYQPYINDHEYILENYLVNYVFKNIFPLNGQKHVFDNYVMLIVHHSMIKMLLIGMAGFHKENFNTDHVIKLIQSFAKTIEHNNIYLKNVFTLLKTNKFTTMAYMAILIKN